MKGGRKEEPKAQGSTAAGHTWRCREARPVQSQIHGKTKIRLGEAAHGGTQGFQQDPCQAPRDSWG